MTEAHVSDEEEEVIAKQPKPKQHDAGASDLEGIRDFRDEEVSSCDCVKMCIVCVLLTYTVS